MRLYLIRHGETQLNQKSCYYGKTDAVLTAKGEEQADALGKYLKDISFDQVFVSPLKRAVETADRLCLGRKIAYKYDSRLEEQDFGIFEGMTAREIMHDYPVEWEKWNKDFSNHRIQDGESFRDVRSRIDDFIQKELNEAEGNILIVAHKGTLGHMIASMLHMPLEGYWNFVFEQGTYHLVDLQDGYAIIRGLNLPVK